MGERHHWSVDSAGLAQCSGRARSVLTYDRRLGDGFPSRQRVGRARTTNGFGTSTSMPPGLLHHSDRGSQYTSASYQSLLAQAGIQVSMSRKGNCYDNAAMESFIGSLKEEWTDRHSYQSFEEAQQSIFEFIEVFYN